MQYSQTAEGGVWQRRVQFSSSVWIRSSISLFSIIEEQGETSHRWAATSTVTKQHSSRSFSRAPSESRGRNSRIWL